MPEIVTNRGVRILVDQEDWDAFVLLTWHLDGNGYAATNLRNAGHRRSYTIVCMHRLMMGLAHGDPRQVDHINGNKLDNRRSNLRICTAAENRRNRGASAKNKVGMKGVSFHRKSGRYRAQIRTDGVNKHLGVFRTPELAYEFYCLAADMLHGEFANHGA